MMDMSTSGQQVAVTNGASIQLTKRQQQARRQQFSSFIFFLSVIIIVNLSPFSTDLELFQDDDTTATTTSQISLTIPTSNRNEQNMLIIKPSVATEKQLDSSGYEAYLTQLRACLKFIGLMFTNPIKLGRRTTGSIQAEAKVLGKMAKMWYIKKKIKKLSKKLKKHTIAVPVFTAIPIYEHSY